MRVLVHDLRYGLRALIRTPVFTVTAVLVLALGIGANATVFSLANALFLRRLPVADPDTLVRVYSNRHMNTPYRAYLEYRDRNSTLTGLAAFQIQSFGARIEAETEPSFGSIVSGNYFPLLGLMPAHGRLIDPSDDRPGAAPAVVLSHAFWKRRFAAAPAVIGRTIGLNDQSFTVIGVAGERFTGLMTPLVADFWVPLAADALLRPALDPAARLETTSLHLIGRLKPRVDRTRAGADLDTIGRQLRASAGLPDQGPAVSVYPATVLHPEIAPPVSMFLAVLMTLVALVLLIVCANVANLVLARAAGRHAELAIRQSLGADRARLVRQLLTENLMLSLVGAAGGLAIAFGSTRLLMAVQLPTPFPIAFDLSLDARVLAFTIAAAIGATLAFGLVPALSASRIDLVQAIKGMAAGGPRQSRLRPAFLVAQVSMSVLLLVTAGLFVKSFYNARAADPGFDASHVLVASIDLETRGYSAARGREFVRTIVERLEAAPGVVSANVVDIVPVTLSNNTGGWLRESDADPAPGQPPPTPEVFMNAVGPGHFRTLDIAMVTGRDFTPQDDAAAPGVAIVNETFARRFWPGASALGQRLRPFGAGPAANAAVEIVGVVRDSTYVTVGEAERPFLYRPFAQEYTPRITLLIRSSGMPGTILPVVRREVRALDAGLAVFNVSSMADATSISLVPARIAGDLLGALGLLALVLAALGMYGVLSFLVRARTRELGVRVALGATPRTVAAMVVRQAMTWTAIGGVLGMALAFLLTRFLEALLYGISPTDPATFAGVIFLLAGVSFIAALVPAVRASRLDPLAALRTS